VLQDQEELSLPRATQARLLPRDTEEQLLPRDTEEQLLPRVTEEQLLPGPGLPSTGEPPLHKAMELPLSSR